MQLIILSMKLNQKKDLRNQIKMKKALENLIGVLKNVSQNTPAEEIQTKIYTAGKENGYSDNLRDWFKLIYEVCFEKKMVQEWFFISFWR